MQKQSSQVFCTENLYLASALMASECQLTHTTERAPNRHTFEFSDPRARELASKFITGSLNVDAQRLFLMFDDLRTMVRKNGFGRGVRNNGRA
jgi:hypothetical protein